MFNFFKKKFFQKESQPVEVEVEKIVETEQEEPQISTETQEFEEPVSVAEVVEETHYEELQPDIEEEVSQDVQEEVISEEICEPPYEAVVPVEYEEPRAEVETESISEVEEQEVFQDTFVPEEVILEEKIQEEQPSVIEYEESQIQAEMSGKVEYEQISDKFFKLSFGMLKDAISKTTEAISGQISSIVPKGEKIDDDILDELEEILIKTDVGVDLAAEIVDGIRAIKDKITTDEINDIIKEEFKKVIAQAGSNQLNFKEGLNIFLITGVNGAGKTTMIGKLAHRFKLMGGKVLIAAGDTFRAAAEEQLDIWSKRAGADIVRRDGADSASVVFDAIRKARSEDYDVLLIDTAGRLQNKFNLMEELKKIKKVIDNEASGQIAESILVLDANMGQNGLLQAEVFKEAVQITAVGLTKLDGSAKGGIIAGIAKKFNLPVKLIGVGEKIEDLKDFNADDFVDALFGK